jgi:hypothetical protein
MMIWLGEAPLQHPGQSRQHYYIPNLFRLELPRR